jgi:hypothetical protein
MADIAIQQLSTLGQPLVSPNEPVVTQDAVQKLTDAYHQGFITTNDILEHTGALATQKGVTQQKLLEETVAPEAVEARKQQQVLAGDKAKKDRADLLSKDFIDAYLKYNLPLKKTDGSPDYQGMAEVGQKYADYERTMAYAKMGTTGTPQQYIDEQGRQRTRILNAFGEDITQVPGKKNAALEHYQKLHREASKFLLQNDNEPEVPEGKEAPQISVSPRVAETTSAPVVVPATQPEATGVFPIVMPGTPAGLGPQVAMPPAAGPKLTIAPTANGGHSITVEPKPAASAVAAVPSVQPSASYGGEGFISGYTPGTLSSPKEIVENLRGQETYKNWAEKAPKINQFRQIVSSYAHEKPGDVTTQKDLALATTALMLAMPGGGGSRGMPEGRYRTIEEMQPLIEQVFHFVPKFLKKEAFTPETRQRIIEEANRSVVGLESGAASSVKNAVGLFSGAGLPPEKFLTEDERRLASSAAAPAGEGAGAAAQDITLSNGRKIRVVQR